MLSLLFVGIGWNFAFIGSTALLSTVYTNSEKFKVQATNDVTVFGCSSFAVLVSGFAYDEFGKKMNVQMYLWRKGWRILVFICAGLMAVALIAVTCYTIVKSVRNVNKL
jgi:MFS family permease